jgi:hypothetical protein
LIFALCPLVYKLAAHANPISYLAWRNREHKVCI